MSTHDGGKPNVKPLRYSPPVGPINQNRPGPGLRGGVNHGNGQQCEPYGETSKGGHGTNHGNSGSQRSK